MQTGTVKTFNSERGFGFITRDAGGADIFFHVDQVDESIEELSYRRLLVTVGVRRQRLELAI
jgi:cold shock CspA family protein